MESWLKELSDKWSVVENKSVDTGDGKKKVYKIPEGTDHTFLILDASVSLTPEKQYIKYRLQMKSHKDWIRTKFSWLGGDMKYPKNELALLGLDIESIPLTELSNHISKVVGSVVKGTVKNVPGKDYQNFYFNSFVGKEDVPQSDDSDIPFVLPDESSWDNV